MASEFPPTLLVDGKEWSSFFEELRVESDRAVAILTSAWIDDLLRRKLAQTYSKGNAETRQKIFSHGGAFSGFSAKIDSVFCAGWIDVDVHHDLHLLRRVRNEFAHQIHGLTMESPKIKRLVDDIRVPHREFYDWGQLKASATKDGKGVILFTGEQPQDAGETLTVPPGVIFRMAASWVIAFLAADLKIGIVDSEE